MFLMPTTAVRKKCSDRREFSLALARTSDATLVRGSRTLSTVSGITKMPSLRSNDLYTGGRETSGVVHHNELKLSHVCHAEPQPYHL
jgi:hypothetical protein